MIIKSVRVERFKCLFQFEAALGPGLVVVHGPNESGKTSLLSALIDAFFTKPGSRSRDMKQKKTWQQDAYPGVVLEIEVEDQGAVLKKDFAEKSVEIKTPEKTITSPEAAQEWIKQKLGCPTQEFFLATACVREDSVELPRIDAGKSSSKESKEIIERLQAMLTGAPGGSPGQVMKRLRDQYDQIRRGPTASRPGAGPVHVLRGELEEARNRLHRIRELMSARDLAAAELEKNSSRQKALAEELSTLKTAIANHRLFLQSAEAERETADKLDRLIKAEGHLKRVQKLEKEIESYQGYHELEGPVDRLKELAELSENMERRMSELSFEKYELKERTPSASVVLMVLSGVLALAGGLAAAFTRSAWPFVAGLAAGLPVFASGLVIRRRSASREKQRREEVDAQISRHESSMKEVESETNGLLKRFNRVSVEDCLSAFQDYRSALEEISQMRERAIELAGTDDAAELSGMISRLSVELRSIKERMSELEPFRLEDSRSLASMENEKMRKVQELERLERSRMESEARMSAASFDPGELASLEEEEAELSERLEYWESRMRVFEKAMSVLEQATAAVMKKAGKAVEEEIAPMISAVTEGRYQRVRAGVDLHMEVFAERIQEWIPEHQLSLATREQLHFAARLALVRLITDDKRPPLILDDPFAHYDEQRLEKVMEVAKQAARTNQVILFSPTDRYNAFADKVIKMG